MDKRSRSRASASVNSGLAAIAEEGVSRYGSAIKEHFVAYSGVDNETGQVLKRSLKSISQSKVNPDFAKQNIKQQAGFSAETKEVARRRAEQILKGRRPTITRTDDIAGHVNDELYDITSKVDAKGNPIPGASAQMKFVGSSPKDAVTKMLGKDYQKYIDNDCKIVVPSDYFDGMKVELDDRISNLERQIKRLKSQGRGDIAAHKEKQLRKCQRLRRNLRKSKVSNDEALEARTNPIRSTVKDVLKNAHAAGIEQAKVGAFVGGGISLVRNFIDVCRGKKDKTDAVCQVAGDTAGAAAVSYATGSVGSLVKAAAQNAPSKHIRALSKTNLPATVVTVTLETGKTLKNFFSGEIDGAQCLEELGEKGFGMISSSMFAVVGQMAIPVPIVGAMAGSMIGYALSSASYRILSDSLTEAKMAKKRREQIERECNEMLTILRECRKELQENIDRYLAEKSLVFEKAFSEIKKAFEIGDVDGYIAGTNSITEAVGGKTLFRDMTGCDALMLSDDPIVI